MTTDRPFVFGTKAETLLALRPLLQSAIVQETMFFTVEEWAGNREGLLDDVAERFGDTRIVIRSSAIAEDGADSSMAGQFDSILSIPAQDATRVAT